MNSERLTRIEEKCRARGLALTVQRRVILEELIDRTDHPTADQIHEAVRDRVPGLSLKTVYRALDTLVELGAARKVSHVGAVVRFDPNVERHHHLICESCGELVDLNDSAIPEIAFPKTPGFTILDFSVYFTGVCDGCRNTTNQEGEACPT
jgi:Fur family peroxide stress response transcriptional regulator